VQLNSSQVFFEHIHGIRSCFSRGENFNL